MQSQEMLKRPMESLPKEYKDNAKYVEYLLAQNEILSPNKSSSDKSKYKITRDDVPRLFILDESHINLPDMTKEELKLVFPYFWDVIGHNIARYLKVTKEEFAKLYELSKKKRIPFELGKNPKWDNLDIYQRAASI